MEDKVSTQCSTDSSVCLSLGFGSMQSDNICCLPPPPWRIMALPGSSQWITGQRRSRFVVSYTEHVCNFYWARRLTSLPLNNSSKKQVHVHFVSCCSEGHCMCFHLTGLRSFLNREGIPVDHLDISKHVPRDRRHQSKPDTAALFNSLTSPIPTVSPKSLSWSSELTLCWQCFSSSFRYH